MEESVKIVFTGTVGSGKTQAIQVLSDIPVVSTDVEATDDVVLKKETTTVAMDYGEVALDDTTTLALYGTPGQERFRYMWEILSRGALGIVIMVDNSRPDPISDMEMYLENFKKFIDESCAIIAVTHGDVSEKPDMDEYHRYLADKNLMIPIYRIDAREKPQVLLLVETMMVVLEIG